MLKNMSDQELQKVVGGATVSTFNGSVGADSDVSLVDWLWHLIHH
ncbi:bacteriocin [Bombilactobacillus folatiphilus]|uniref:Bacteriocin n=1 Tax=Bombilactobacillus folatiphilus TaxID=2923362 RepID=A0ABY4P7T8_9LACO|nr:bacteriocin [Bombilactobacillus folatiphilus]UQS81674.1 bacteriocin [Bombilactobacillus folatiphilus]UQS81675.1 bacteriocin [Bombilactobacillus folatiphilus]UQS81676.1 bacteriocin [Bombilactobacillus folatiphilus]